MDTIWWKQITKAHIFAEKIINTLKKEQSVVLIMPRFVPWYESLFQIIEDGLTANGIQRKISIYNSTDDDPGKMLLNDFCKKEVRSEYRIGKSYADFLATRPAIILNSSIIWIRGLNISQYSKWFQFITDYNKHLPRDTSGALFILEAEETISPYVKGKIQLLSFSSDISAYDRYTFCTLACSSTSISTHEMPYIAELVSSVCGNDIELCAECIKDGVSFAKDPVAYLFRIAETSQHSDGSSFEIESILENIDYHIWESQIRLLFPIIERYRTGFIKKHRRDIENTLPITNKFNEIIETPEDVEIGLLYALASMKAIELSSNDEFHDLFFYKEMRNKLAHIKPIDYDSVFKLLRTTN